MSGLTIEEVIETSNKVTILTAKKTVNSLYDYLHIKGLYLFAKIRPEDNTLLNEENISFIVDFLDKTQLRICPFWSKLERDVKMVAVRYITLRDESDMTLISSTRKKDAGIFILLSGRGTLTSVSNDTPRKTTEQLKHGSVVGPIELFNTEKEISDSCVTYKCQVKSGSVLQLRYMDMHRAKYGDQSIGVDPNEGLTQEEISVRNVSHFGENRLSSGMYQFLTKNNLLATSEKDISFKYIKNGNIGRSLSGKKVQNEVLIVLDGSLRLIFGNSSKVGARCFHLTSDFNNFGDIKCSRPGEGSTTFKIQRFPLSIVENGAILHLDEKILSSGASSEASTAGGIVGGGELDITEDSISLTGGVIGGVETTVNSSSPCNVDLLEHISLQFDKPTTYLAIPLKKIRNALQNETHRINIDIRQEINEVTHSLAARLEKLKPLLNGGFVYTGDQDSEVVSDQKVESLNGDIASAESSLAGAYGIFSKLECNLEADGRQGQK